MGFPRSFRAAATLAIGFSAGVSAAPALADTKTFDLRISGINVGTVTLSGQQEGDSYRATSQIEPNALVGMFTDYAFDGQASGTLNGSGEVRPSRFTAESTSPRATRVTVVEWDGERPTRVSVEPPRKHQPDPAQVVGALDPVSAGFALLRDSAPDDICNASIDVFDGSRRSRLAVAPAQRDGEAWVCNGLYANVEGEAHSMSEQKEYPFRLVYGPVGADAVRLERIETDTRFGRAVLARRG